MFPVYTNAPQRVIAPCASVSVVPMVNRRKNKAEETITRYDVGDSVGREILSRITVSTPNRFLLK